MFADKWPSGVTVWRTYWSWGRRSRDSASWTLEGHPLWSSEHEQKIIWRIGVITTILKHNRSLGVIPSSGLNKETQPIFSQLRHETLASEWILTWSMCSLLFSLKFHRQHTTCETMVVNKWHTHTHRGLWLISNPRVAEVGRRRPLESTCCDCNQHHGCKLDVFYKHKPVIFPIMFRVPFSECALC